LSRPAWYVFTVAPSPGVTALEPAQAGFVFVAGGFSRPAWYVFTVAAAARAGVVRVHRCTVARRRASARAGGLRLRRRA
jgi:hypothetical protein